MKSGFAGSTVKILLVLFSCLAAVKALVTKEIDENKDKGYIVHTFPSPLVGKVYTFFQAKDEELANALKLFQISTSGVVKTTKPIFFEIGKANSYDLVALERPPGATEGGVATSLRVKIKDTNNFNPTFPADIYDGWVKEQSSENVLVEGLEDCFAEDRDQSGMRGFKISSGNDKGYFKTDKKKVGDRLFLILKTTATKIVRDDATPNIVLTVRAEDGVRYGSTKIRINILDFNDNEPEFGKNPYSETIAENTPLMTSVLRVRAIDKDVGANGGIYYYLKTLSDYFSVDAITGVIKVVQELDYQAKSSHSLTVVAKDRGNPSKSSQTLVEIKIQDMPNFPRPPSSNPGRNTKPFFPDGPYTANVREDLPVKAALLVIHALDRDPAGSTDSVLSYRILSGASGKFEINPRSGVVTLSNTLDYESLSSYVLEVEARDGGGEKATTALTIKVQDVDENRYPPTFSPQQRVVSIDENQAVGTQVVQVSASDRDQGQDGQVVYSAVKGSGLRFFEVDQSSGVVKTAAPLDREETSFYELMIEARDKATFPLVAYLYLMINVGNADDYTPDFSQPMYSAKVPEKADRGTFVTVVHAVDRDGPSFSYQVTGGAAFTMESETGVITTSRILDPSQGETSFTLQVIARNGKQADALVNVTVTSRSDSPPAFKESTYKVSVPENQGHVDSLLCIAAIDPLGRPAKYSIAAPSDGRFSIISTSGKFGATSSFDYESVAEGKFTMEVRATSGKNQQAASTNVVVTIQDTRDPPTFEKNKFEINVNEDSGGGTTLSNGLLIVDQDTSKNNFICSLEKITSIDVIDTFKVVNDQGQCKLVTQARIDHYTTPQFSFEVRATDKSYLNMYASADVVVKVIDKNNHAPVFSQSSYWVSVQSTLPKDSTVLTVKAVDKDAGTNGDFVYQLVNSQDSQRFDLSGNNGVLKSASSLAANNKYQLKIKAVDKSGKSSEVTVYVSVYGPSVNHIQFSKDSYSTEQMENVKVNTAVLTVKASGRVGITYAIVGGNEENVFKISSGGVISVAKALDRERTPEYKLAVRASTSGGSGGLDLATEVICTITVKDVNDNSPRFAFTKIPKEVSVDSYSSVGTKVLEVKALDKDAGSFGKVTYDIDTANSDPTDPPFTIGSKSGLLEVSRNIPSKANRASYKVIVEATDGGGKSSTAEVRVTVNDVKPPPKFSSASYEVTVPENGKVGDTVKNIKAIYGDNSALLKYKIVSGNTEGTFCINRDGLITIARPLDREEISNYELKVEVRYGNSKGTTTVKVGITDINDDTPHFTQSVYTFEVDEDTAPNGVEVGKVTATDFDTGTNGEIGYRILYSVDARSYPGLFEIKPVGVISTKRNIVLDYERIKQHVLYVRASDNGSPSLKEIAKVIINVKDINDNKPRFSAQSYSAKVPLDAKTESHILQVTATDLDSGVNGQVQYSITNGNEEGAFKINPNNGFISLKKSLTTVSASQFRIAVLATDMGEGRNNGTATVQVSVYLPDGPPKFVDATVVAKVEEGVRNNERVLVVKAATSEALIYEIVSGNADGMFRIVASTGEIKATRTLDYEEKREYRIEVRARDTRDRTAVVNIIIKVKNINDNRPVFPGQMGDLVERKVEGKFQVGDPVARLTAFDKDGEKITYRILSPSSTKSYFMVDDDGFLRSRKSIDDLPSPYEFRMEARDSGNPPKATTVDVRLIFVHYRPYQQPVRVDVLESETVGSIIATVPRYFPGSSLSLIYPHNANFSVDDNGKLSTTGPLDYEEQKFYSLTIREKEPTAPFRNNDVDIEINVIDVNDNKPVFTMPDLFGRVNTNARPGTSAYQPRATDEDDASNGIVGYQLVTHNQVFVINPFQNTVETGNVLGSDGSYKVELFAFDYGIPRQESDVISIEIKTVKFPPRFSKNLYIFNVSEAAFGGKVVGQVKATSSSRARLSFSIVQGDSEKKFRAKPDGVIVVNYFLDHEKQSLYSLKVRAEEQILQGYSSETDVQIKVINANDHYPRFTKSVYPKSVREDATGSVLKVKAQDCDCSICECPNGLLKYSLSGTEFFKVDSDTGDISVSKPLDFERQTVHVFRVSVRDFGEKKTYTDLAYVRIEVLNVNDNEPAFAEEEYRTGISENAEPSKSLAAVLATDADGDQLSYSISSGGGDIFKIDQNSGVISLAKKLPSGSQIQYTLQVRATDPEKKYQEVRLVVEVEDSNNHAPVFTACTTAKVAENLPAGKRVTKVVAEDKNDRGRNKEIEYSLKHGGERLFRIDNATGEIFTESTLDRERSKSYSLTVQAEDGGHGRNEAERLLSYCFLEITVEDKNDNYPEFLSREYLGSVWHKSPVGTTILTVSATDVDDDANSQVEYSFVGLNDLFLITSGGAVRTKTALTNNLQTTRLTVRAKNRKSMETGQRETRNSKTTIEITVTDKKPPKCGDDLFTFRISEKKAVDEKVGIVSAQSQTGSTSIAYSLVKDNPNVEQAFQVRPDGEIRTGGQLDYERIKEYTLQIRAKETDTNLYSTCVAKIRLDDENDDAPNFQLEDYYARVPENAGSGFKVVTVKATDKDDDGRAKVTYSIDDKDKLSDYQFFAINQDSGVITTKRDFDRETKARYNLIVIASDKNTKPEVRVEVNVVDVNDVAPKFSQANYEAKVSEDAGVGTSVTQLSATDGDIGENARLDYFVSAGSGLQKFKMETVYGKSNYGVLILDGSLDYETLTEYTIYVTATDRKDSTSAKVTIKVLDANDNTPEFTELIYDTKIPEESGAGVLVQSVTATDRDSATIQNALKYSLDANGKKYFKINEKSGTIVTSGGKLDRELSPYFVFSVYAFDGKHRGKAAVRVELSDINDNAPVFPSPPYVGYVLEHKPKGESVMVVEAVDRDDGINSNLVYSLVENPGNRFKIDYKGLLSTTKELDRETTPNEFTVTVKATDSGSPSKSGTTRAKIIVADANDQKPKFTKEVYRGAVAEDALPGYSVTEVSATDADEGFNAELEYSIIKGNDPSAFYLDPRTGKTYVSGLLDYDKGKKVYELTVIVRDRGLPPLQADKPAKIVITIGDANDNAPRFVPDSYRLTLAEDFKIGETLLKVTAVDHDSGSFAAFNFSIGKGDESNIFGIKPDSKNGSIGLIYTFLELDRETALSHNLTIVATDLAGLTGTATVYLTIADVNDNGPWFVPPYFEAEVRENVNTRQFVTTISAMDPDESSNGPPFSFNIVNVTSRFSIARDSDLTAKIHSSGSFDREAKPRWTLKVKGTDSGSPRKTNETYVYIKIKDDNDNEPFDGELFIFVNVYRGKFDGGVIGKPYYKDEDSDGDVNEYKITSQSGSYFTIDSRSGNITARRGMPVGSYSLTVDVTEQNRRSGSNTGKTVTSQIKVVLRPIPEAAVQNSVAVQFLHVRKVSFFVGDFYLNVQSTLARMLGVSDDRLLIFSIQKAPLRHLPVGAFSAVEIQLAVEIVESEVYMTFLEIVKKLTQQKKQLINLGLVVGDIGIDECAREYQDVGKCENVVRTSSKFTVASGDYGKIPAPGTSLTIVSMDVVLKGEYSAIFPLTYDCSTNNPCLHGGTCHTAVPKGTVICECARGYTGPHCEWSTRTFYGNSYIWLAALTAYERSEVSMTFITKDANGLLLYQGPLYTGANNGLGDFMAVMMVGGYIQLKMTLGPHPSAPLVMYMDRGYRLDDGNWHIVQVSRQLKVVKVIIDKCEKAQVVAENGRVFEDRRMCEMEADVWGSSLYLNGFGPLQIGGVQNEVEGLSIQYKGFKGCIRNIYDNGDMYDLESPPKVVNAPKGCEFARRCPNCNGHGYCEPLWNVHSICVCDLGFSGINCNGRSQANWYTPGSFSQYKVKQKRRKRRELVPPPVSMSNGFYSNIALQVKVEPTPKEVVIFLASNSLGTEFNRIDVNNGVIRYIFRLGDRMKILKIPEFNITDGKYHSVVVKREGNRASMQIDYEGKVEGTTGGIHKLLNMGSGSFFAGGMPNITELRIVQAWVKSGGNAILRGADGSVVSSGLGAGASGVLSGSTFVGTMIDIGSLGEVRTKSYSSTKKVTLTGYVAVQSSYKIIIGHGGVGGGTGLGSQGGAVVRNVQIKTSSSSGSSSSAGGGVSSAGGGSASGGGTVTGAAGGSSSAGGGGGGGGVAGSGGLGIGGSGATGGIGLGVWEYGAPTPMVLGAGSSVGASADGAVHVFGDFGGCTAENRYNGADLESDPSIIVERQNVAFGCPCESGFCFHAGTCVNAAPPYCLCAPGWSGPRCEDVVKAPNPGTRPGSLWRNNAVIAIMLVVFFAILFIVGAAILKRRKPPVVVVTEDGHVHDNVRPYHDEGAGEEDNFGYDIHQLMKYTYIESGAPDGLGVGVPGPFTRRPGAGEEEITVAEDKPLLRGAMDSTGKHAGVTSIRKQRLRNPESVDVGTFIDTRVSEADEEYVLSVDELHVYRYEGDDSDVDDLSELGSDDEEQEDEQDFAFLGTLGRKFDNLNRIFNEDD